MSRHGTRLSSARPCSTCGIPTRSTSGQCRDCRPRAAKRPTATCPRCGFETTAKDGVCRSCRVTEAKPSPYEDGLYGGRWVGGLVKRWEQNPPPPPTEQEIARLRLDACVAEAYHREAS